MYMVELLLDVITKAYCMGNFRHNKRFHPEDSVLNVTEDLKRRYSKEVSRQFFSSQIYSELFRDDFLGQVEF